MNTELMAPRKNKRNKASMAIAKAIIDEYQPTNAEEMCRSAERREGKEIHIFRSRDDAENYLETDI